MYPEVYLRLELGLAFEFLAQGQTNFVKMLWKFNSVYNCQRQFADHHREVRYAMQLPEARQKKVDPATLYVIQPQPLSRAIGMPGQAHREAGFGCSVAAMSRNLP